MGYYTLMFGHMGKITSDRARSVYNCSNQKPNFSKAFSMLSDKPFTGVDYILKKSQCS